MSIKTRLTAFVLAAVMATAALAGCTKKDDSNNPSSTGADSTPTTQKSKLTILAPSNDNPELKFEDREQYPIWDELVKLFDAKNLELEFEIVAPDQYEVTAQTRVAAGKNLPDVINLSSFSDEAAMALANNGTILPINKMVDEYSDGTFYKFIKEDYSFIENLTTAPDGNIYWFTNVQNQTYEGKPARTCQVMNLRKDWLEKYNLQAPKTADEFFTVMKTFRDKDANGNGQKDEIIDAPINGFMNGIAQWYGLGNYTTAVDVKNGKIVSPWYQDNVKEYFAFMQKLVKEGIVDTDLVGATYEQINQRMVENKIGGAFTYCMQTWLEPSVQAEGVEFLPVALLKGTEDATPYNVIEPEFFSWKKWVVSKDCKNPAGVAALLDVIYSPKYEEITAWGIEGVTYEVVDGRRQQKEGFGNAFWKDMAASKTTYGGPLWSGCVFPGISLYTMESQFASRPEHKNEFQKEVAFYENIYPDSKYCYTAIATDEQNKRKSSIVTDLETYSAELCTDLVLGNASFDKWDDYIAQLKKLGLDELIEIEQAQLDKFNSFN
ncbi:MAG: extracellular solute-binding protein [Oscillospiraceae bacterium]